MADSQNQKQVSSSQRLHTVARSFVIIFREVETPAPRLIPRPMPSSPEAGPVRLLHRTGTLRASNLDRGNFSRHHSLNMHLGRH